MSPPVIAGMVVYPYCALRGIPFVVDAHTGAFFDKRWRHFQKVQQWLCRKAATTIITNAHLEALVNSHGGDCTMLPDVPVRYPENSAPFDKSRFTIAVICSFDYDEPVDLIVQIARALPDVRFLVTGNPKKVEGLRPTFPSNLELTGFLDNAAYGHLLRNADIVMALTTGQHKMLRAAYEAIYQGTPIIISESPMLRAEFDKGGVVVENSVEVITAAVRRIQQNPEHYHREVAELREFKSQRWERNKRLLLSKIGLAHAG
jgi:glycosyltransferase involved in cell wall biosynthesis